MTNLIEKLHNNISYPIEQWLVALLRKYTKSFDKCQICIIKYKKKESNNQTVDAYLVINKESLGEITDIFATLRNVEYPNFAIFIYMLLFQNFVFLVIEAMYRIYSLGIIGILSWIVLLPLLGSISCGFFGRFIGTYGSMWVSTSLMALSALLSCVAFYQVGLLGNELIFFFFEWIHMSNISVNWELHLDSLAVVMLVVVNVVSVSVHLYSCGYMMEDPHVPRFMSYLSLFTFFMNILVTSNNFVQLFFGWEGVGICSYLLISFWYTRVQAVKAAFKAVIMNKIGDVAFLIAMMILFSNFKTLNFSTIFALVPGVKENTFVFLTFDINVIEASCFFLAIGAIAKSAQIGLHTWLADAMEGPTPVSALIHAATMVTAGIFLIIRCSPMFEFAEYTLMFMTVIGSVTAFIGATIAMVQYDIKKIIAFSTMSQLGYMFFAAGLSAYNLSLYHLFNHAFFKALLFLSAGSLIHSMSDEQDIRKMGGLLKASPVTIVCFTIGTLSLVGFPFTSGFFSKELILNHALSVNSTVGYFAYILGIITAFLTAFYSFRLIYWVFFSEFNGFWCFVEDADESDFLIATPMIILSLLSIVSGFFFKDVFSGKGSNFFKQSIFIHEKNYIDSEFIPLFFKVLPIFVVFLGIFLGMHMGFLNKITNVQGYYRYFGKLHLFIYYRYHIDTLYNKIALKFLLKSYILYKFVDQKLIEITGPALARSLFSSTMRFWKLNMSNSSALIYIQLGAMFISLISITYILGYLYFQII